MRCSRIRLLILLIGVCCQACVAQSPHGSSQLPSRKRFRDARNYYLYYAADHFEDLAKYDVAILHIPKMTPPEVRKLSDLGVVTIGYISVGEDEALHVGDGNGPGGKASWYLDKDHDGKPDENGIWKSYYANASDPAWRAECLRQARVLVDEYGFEGFFLDTIEMPDAYPEARTGMIQLVKELREAFPDKVIVANRAFSLLKEPDVAGNIDAILYESFSGHYDFDAKRYYRFSPSDLDGTRKVIEQFVLPVMKKYPDFRVLALDYADPKDSQWIQVCFDRAVTFGFLPCVAPIFLDDVYPTSHIVGHPDEKYLKKLATPESIRVTLDEARNGFPAGTIVQPDSCFPGYTAAPVVDGIKDRSTLHWSKSDWASEEEAEEHSLTILLPQPVSGGRTFRFRYAVTSPEYRVDVQQTPQSDWHTIAQDTRNTRDTIDVPLPAGPVSSIRIVQPAGRGSKDRPNLMWIQQVEWVK
jgi:hypothetical protein